MTTLDDKLNQAEIAHVFGISQPRVSELESAGVWQRGSTLREVIAAYAAHLREVAAGRGSAAPGGLDLVQERAALARSQREGQDIKNGIALKTYAPIALLAETLAFASQAVAEQFDQLPAALRRVCPELPAAARDQVRATIAQARNEWVARTCTLLAEHLDDGEADNESGDHPDEPGNAK